MGDTTGINWTDSTWAPIRGCSRISEGCRNCYAERIAARFSKPGMPYDGFAEMTAFGPRWTGKVALVDEHLCDPLRWRKPRKIFLSSTTDVFHEKVPNDALINIFAVMALSPRHTYQVLTKRAARMEAWFGIPDLRARVLGRAWEMLGRASSGCPQMYAHENITERAWPLPNVWLGTSVENQDAADERIPALLRTPAAIRFLSLEPLLGLVDLHAIQIPDARAGLRFSALQRQHDDRFGSSDTIIDWAIVGCESGPGARPCQTEWIRVLRDQCLGAGVAFWLKQATYDPREDLHGQPFVHHLSGDDTIKIGRGKVIDLPYLDGHQHHEFPRAASLVPVA
jgi:protein gp37